MANVGDTWGLGGSEFLALYSALALMAAGIIWALWRRMTDAGAAPAQRQLDAYGWPA